MKNNLFLPCFVMIIVLLNGCNDKDLITPDTNAIEYISFQSHGCVSAKTLAKVSYEPKIDWKYLFGNLTISVTFATHCSALMKDSVIFTNNKIEIFLSDTNYVVTDCVCSHKEDFIFKIKSRQKIEATIYYKAITSKEYHKLVTSNIK